MMLGLNGKHTVGIIAQSPKDHIKPAVTSSASKMSANNSKLPSLEAVNNNSKPNKLLDNPSKEQTYLVKNYCLEL
ncbi:hypothetical protein [Wolbachia endosymbiont of Tettigetta isshikii]|uniref:hypothetical protein n=1 Tax=Wolbachia endosymbiont of Tettigetta isshikii TaxID=3239093 RepID=UPI0039806BB9